MGKHFDLTFWQDEEKRTYQYTCNTTPSSKVNLPAGTANMMKRIEGEGV